MDAKTFHAARRFVTTSFGRIAYVERGTGPAALFLHGVPLNGFHWRHALDRLSDVRRCIAVDLMGLGWSDVSPTQDLSFTAQARMVAEFLDALDVRDTDVVANDSGGAVAQLFAVRDPARVRTLTLTNCDVHDNWPPPALAATMDACREGLLGPMLHRVVRDVDLARSPAGLGVCYADPASITAESLETYLGPLVADAHRMTNLHRYFLAFDCRQTVAIESALRALDVPTLVVWGTDDVFFDVRWARWLADTIPGVRQVAELPGRRLFFPEEEPELMERLLREHWTAAGDARTFPRRAAVC